MSGESCILFALNLWVSPTAVHLYSGQRVNRQELAVTLTDVVVVSRLSASLLSWDRSNDGRISLTVLPYTKHILTRAAVLTQFTTDLYCARLLFTVALWEGREGDGRLKVLE